IYIRKTGAARAPFAILNSRRDALDSTSQGCSQSHDVDDSAVTHLDLGKLRLLKVAVDMDRIRIEKRENLVPGSRVISRTELHVSDDSIDGGSYCRPLEIQPSDASLGDRVSYLRGELQDLGVAFLEMLGGHQSA